MSRLQEDEIVDLLDWCAKHAKESDQDFVASLAEYWEIHGKLSDRQQQVLEAIYARC